ncbi:SixA phosphatase family protein [Brevundimonas lutea]|uniref:SixA phosphatase family protein n=1 Tax=Brevundimonas lutea TaxID=2293980 RepID=UPI000F02F247|nr:phosphoglycerate mutase family protein [Brevundimonas lutea]
MIRTLCLSGALALMAAPALAQTVVIVRHAEKADASSDPDLSEAGRARAEALAGVVAGLGVDHVLISPLKRTGQTAAPATEAAGLTPEGVSLEGGGEAHVAAVAARARQAGPGETVLIAGHSNTVPSIARALGGQGIADMEDCEYDRLIVLRLAEDAADTLVARYGEPTECPRD